MKFKKILPVLALAAAMGCNSSLTKAPRNQKQEMTEQWNTARSGVLASLATEQYGNGNLVKARESVDNAIKMSPKIAALHVLSGKIAIEQGQLELAQKELQLATLQDPRIAEADYLLGVVFQRWQQPDKAYEQYESASAKAPAELAYVLASAEMLVDMNRPDDALNMLQAKADQFEHSPEIRDEMGQLLVGKRQYPQAVKVLREATMLAADDQSIREHLARCFITTRNIARRSTCSRSC